MRSMMTWDWKWAQSATPRLTFLGLCFQTEDILLRYDSAQSCATKLNIIRGAAVSIEMLRLIAFIPLPQFLGRRRIIDGWLNISREVPHYLQQFVLTA